MERPDDAGFDGRRPTSHERMSGRPWDASYRDGRPPWDVGAPQPVVVRLTAAGAFTGAVLDAGCGTGENALHIAAEGLSVVGIDVAETPVRAAREKAAAQGVEAEFLVADALRLTDLERRFDTVLDVGLFHTFDADERTAYVAGLASATGPGARLFLLCFRADGPDAGPHPVRRDELTAAFGPGTGWRVDSIEPERVATTFHDHGAPAWLATLSRA